MSRIRRANQKGYLRSVTTLSQQVDHRLNFQFNPNSISESRGVLYNYSQAQGQALPLAQFGMVENTKLSFELFMFSHNGLKEELKSLRRLTLPKQLTRLTYYEQVKPHKYLLNLGDYGVFYVAVDRVDIETAQYSKNTLNPVRLTANLELTVISTGITSDVSHLKDVGGYS